EAPGGRLSRPCFDFLGVTGPGKRPGVPAPCFTVGAGFLPRKTRRPRKRGFMLRAVVAAAFAAAGVLGVVRAVAWVVSLPPLLFHPRPPGTPSALEETARRKKVARERARREQNEGLRRNYRWN